MGCAWTEALVRIDEALDAALRPATPKCGSSTAAPGGGCAGRCTRAYASSAAVRGFASIRATPA